MILLLDTSTPICKLTLIDGDTRIDDQWEAGRSLAYHLLSYIHSKLDAQGKTWHNISGIGVFEGPGSFTGLRIGMTVVNTIASSESIAIVGTRGDDWQAEVCRRLKNGEDQQIVLPFYGSEAHITSPRK